MHNASGDNYRNSSFIVDEAMGQIPHSTERISSNNNNFIEQTSATNPSARNMNIRCCTTDGNNEELKIQ